MEERRVMQMLSDLQRYNPWWGNPAQFQQDPHWRTFQNSRLHWEPVLLDQVDLEQDAIYTLRGPRQVGKTTLLKQWIGRLLARVPDPQAVFYYSCDLLSDKQELFSLLQQYQAVSYTHLRAHETRHDLVCRLLLE